MAHKEDVFPEAISYGSVTGPSFKTDVLTLDSGAESRIGRWASPRHKFNVAEGVKTMDQLYELKEFFWAMQGSLDSFNFVDPADYSTTANGRTEPAGVTALDVTMPAGDGSATRQMFKEYTVGSTTRSRTIQKPKSGTVKTEVNGVALVEGIGFNVDYTTGIITYVSPPTAGLSITFGCAFYVPCRFTTATEDWLAASYDSFDSGDMDIDLIEVNDELDLPEEFFYGGAVEDVLTGDRLMGVGEGRLWVLLPDASGHKLKLPDETNLPPGGPYFYIVNTSGSASIDITKSDGTTAVLTLALGKGCTILLSQDNAGVKVWYAL